MDGSSAASTRAEFSEAVKESVRLYGEAWTQQRDDLLQNIFSADVVYKERPGRIMNGSQLGDYWREQIGRKERKISFRAYEDEYVIDDVKKSAVVKWEARFESRGSGGAKAAWGSMHFCQVVEVL